MFFYEESGFLLGICKFLSLLGILHISHLKPGIKSVIMFESVRKSQICRIRNISKNERK